MNNIIINMDYFIFDLSLARLKDGCKKVVVLKVN